VCITFRTEKKFAWASFYAAIVSAVIATTLSLYYGNGDDFRQFYESLRGRPAPPLWTSIAFAASLVIFFLSIVWSTMAFCLFGFTIPKLIVKTEAKNARKQG